MGQFRPFKLGEWRATCDQCGVDYWASELKLQWNNYRTCPTCYDPKNAADEPRPYVVETAIPWSRHGIAFFIGRPLQIQYMDGAFMDEFKMG